MRTLPSVPALACVALALVTPSASGAQRTEVTVEVGGSSLLPPTGVEGAAATFLVGGLRASRYGLGGGGAYASLLAGRALDAATGGDFVSAEAGGSAWLALGRGWSAGLEGRVLGFRVEEPFPYEAGAVEGSAVVRYLGRVRLRVAGTGGAGRSRVTLTEVVQRLRHRVEVVEVLEDDLWRWGGTAELLTAGDPVAVGVAAGVHRTAGGDYRSVGLRMLAAGGAGALEVRGDVWRTPDGNRSTGGVAFHLPWGGWRARGVAGRPDPDPLLMADPGRGGGGLLVGRRIFGSDPGRRAGRPLHRIVEAGREGARVRFTVRPPRGARGVEVLGDFTLWEPVGMSADGRGWWVELEVPAGTHHFGFLVDGEWYLPDDVPDAVPDEWGRRNATLIIEGEGGS